jgi:hypothetical protein
MILKDTNNPVAHICETALTKLEEIKKEGEPTIPTAAVQTVAKRLYNNDLNKIILVRVTVYLLNIECL